MKIEQRTLQQATEKGPQFRVCKGKLVAIDGTEPDMSVWADGTTFTLVSYAGLKSLAEMAFIVQCWAS